MKYLLLSAALVFIVVPAYTMDITVGLVSGYSSREYKGIGDDWFGIRSYKGPLPMLMINSEYVSFNNIGLGARAVRTKLFFMDVTFGLLPKRFVPRDSSDPAVRKVDKREMTMTAGLNSGLWTPVGMLGLLLQGDILGRSNSLLATASYKYLLKITNRFIVVPSANITWANSKHNDYYYGITTSEAARSGLPKYDASHAFTPSFDLTLNYIFTEHIRAMLRGSFIMLPDEVRDSPIVDKAGIWNIISGILYKF